MKSNSRAKGAGSDLRTHIPSVLEHFGIGAVTLVIPRLVAQAAGLDGAEVESYCQIAMISVGIATLLQSWGWRGVGSGYLLPACFGGIYLAPILAVAAADGLGAVAGLTIVAGITQIVLSRALRLVRGFVLHNVLGVTIVMIGIGWGLLGLKLIFGVSAGQVDAPLEWLPAIIALSFMIVISVWGNPAIRRISVLIGLITGCAVTALLYPALGERIYLTPDLVLATPHWPMVEISFTSSYLLGFIIGAVASFLRVAGDVVASHNVSDLNWKRPSIKAISAGGVAEGLSNIISGFLGSIPVQTSTGSVGLVASSGVSDANIARIVGIAWIVLGALPFGPPLLLLIPDSTQGAAVFFTAGFVINTGLKTLSERKIDNRQSIMIGSAIIIGLAFDDLVQKLSLSPELRTIFSSALMTSVIAAIVLNAVFQIGVRRSAVFLWEPKSTTQELFKWLDHNARLWSARVNPFQKARSIVEEFTHMARILADGPIHILARYDETSLRLEFTWKGQPLPQSAGVKPGELHDTDEAQIRMAAALFRHHAEQLIELRKNDGSHLARVIIDDL